MSSIEAYGTKAQFTDSVHRLSVLTQCLVYGHIDSGSGTACYKSLFFSPAHGPGQDLFNPSSGCRKVTRRSARDTPRRIGPIG